MLEVFGTDVGGQQRELKRLMGRRNYAIFCVFDPEAVEGAFSAMGMQEKGQAPQGAGRVSLAVDLMVQADASAPSGPGPSMAMLPQQQAATIKYGPVIVPNLEYGR